ncbi:MAG: DEAD/DEAH box helicase family protein [Gammaproteobacteria bacterium]|nr:DEAD/DEAH box helicase family protein [Gammaproteobacteria bacterium]
MANSFHHTLNQIRAIASSEVEKGRMFERLMKTYFTEDPLYETRFVQVQRWEEWAAAQDGFDGQDTGIDLVARQQDGGFCAIQCKCYAPTTHLEKKHVDSFISASARQPFTARIFVDTGGSWNRNAKKMVTGAEPSCQILRFDDLASAQFDWPDLVRAAPEDLKARRKPFSLRPHQQAAFDDVIKGFEHNDRGQLIMACGTGKTFTALRIAEAVAGTNGRVLYLVPSISLLQQSMREWAGQRGCTHRYIGICSDTRAGNDDEDAPIEELEIPVTTDPPAIAKALAESSHDAMTVAFCTYQSLPLIERSQAAGAPGFDLILCDEAHRTTGIDSLAEDGMSPFVLVHDSTRIRGTKRLYMTATPRLYTQSAKTKAASRDIEVFSMDEASTYGPELHRLPFSRAIDEKLLSDYKVVVFALSEAHVDTALQAYLATADGAINLTDAAKIIGCWRALQNPENAPPGMSNVNPLGRAIAFTNRISSSERLAKHWPGLIEQACALLPENERDSALKCETEHVDGNKNALERKAKIEWLKGSTAGSCRILSNARCLSEGIDVPALDAVLFMTERKSMVDIVQAVGRVMRKAKNKEYGYIVLPVAVTADKDPAEALNSGKEFDVVWSVLQALRSHDDRLDAEINQIDLNKKRTSSIIFSGDAVTIPSAQEEIPFPPMTLPPGAIYAKIVDKCGDRKYWENWAQDVADIFARLVLRIGNLLADPKNIDLKEWFDAFRQELRISINESITDASAIDMMAQHILTQPVFDALFDGYDFAAGNPVARALDELRSDFGEFGMENEVRDLEGFYESVRLRARGLDNAEARQSVLMELYQKFFSTALKKDTERLGIVYTPTEVVDFILNSADDVLRNEFGRGLSDEGVHVLDPFTGTGIFIVRLLQSALISDADVARKFKEELHANEIVLLAYYIAAIHIEEAYRGRVNSDYEAYGGIVLTDTFNLHTNRTSFPKEWLPGNSQRAERQQKMPIQVIVGNPPWSVGQASSADDNPNVDYPELESRVAETYAARSSATLKNSLYDTYKMAIRWASDRIGEKGVVAFVTNGSWIDGNVDSGVRACLAAEFSSIWVVNLRGNQRTQGERSRREGGKIFGQGSRAPVAISIFVRNPDATHEGCRILYRDIGDYLKRDEKLKTLRDWASINGVEDWQEIEPNQQHDWINQRDEEFQNFYPMGSKEAKAGKSGAAIFELFSNGYKTGRDDYLYNFSKTQCAEIASRMVDAYQSDEAASPNIHWDEKLKSYKRKGIVAEFSTSKIRSVLYRPFVTLHLYTDHLFAQRPARTHDIFPAPDSENRAISVTGVGSTKPFSALMVDAMPDLELISKGQCFPRYRFEQRADAQGDLFDDGADLVRIDNITDHALRTFRAHYGRNDITKDDIFDYVYGILNAPAYRARFENSLSKELPRIPFAPDFDAFAKAGSRLAELHVGFESCEEWPLKIEFASSGSPEPHHFRLGSRAMRFVDEARTALAINEHIQLTQIPAAAHLYRVNGRTPLEWFIDRYRVTKDRHSGIVNDPNHWFEQPKELAFAIARIVYLSVQSAEWQHALPEAISDEDPEAEKTRAFFESMRKEAGNAVSGKPGEAYEQAFIDSITDWDRMFEEDDEADEQ